PSSPSFMADGDLCVGLIVVREDVRTYKLRQSGDPSHSPLHTDEHRAAVLRSAGGWRAELAQGLGSGAAHPPSHSGPSATSTPAFASRPVAKRFEFPAVDSVRRASP